MRKCKCIYLSKIFMLFIVLLIVGCEKDEKIEIFWEKIGDSVIQEKSFSDIAALNNDLFAINDLTLSSKNNLYKSNDLGNTWEIVSQTPKAFSSIEAFGNAIYGSTDDIPSYGIFCSDNRSEIWTQVNSGLPLGPSNFYAFSNQLLGESSLYVIYGGDLYVLNDGEWELLTGNLSGNVSAYAIGESQLFVKTIQGIFVSTDIGSNWSVFDSNIKNVSALFFYNQNLIAGNSTGLYHSVNGGEFVKAEIKGQSNSSINCICLDGRVLYAGTGNGVLFSGDEGKTWGAMNDGFLGSNTRVNSLVVSKGIIYAATNYGIWKRKL